ncbi:MAG: tetratricopeptide repeat protein [Planctomycetaceae bacterium]|jgi:tetratricopeptide (TPR) repeat protein|nr:tetratricopeptide repeat protein [Planctomycetaceae bacterium]
MKNFIVVIFVFIFFAISDNCFAKIDEDRVRDADRLRNRFWQVIFDSPRRGATFDRLYNLYAESNEINQLINKGVELSQQKSNDSRSWVLLGLIYERCGDIDKAIAAYKRAAGMNANELLASYYLGEMLITQGKLREAINALEMAAEIATKISAQNKSAAKRELRSILLLLGKTAERLGETKKADAVWNQLEKLYPNNPEIITAITNILETEGQIDEAIKRYDQYLKSPSDDYTFIRFKLAVIALKMRKSNTFSPVDDYAQLLDKLDSGGWIAEIVRKRLELYFTERDNFAGLADFYKNRLKKYPNEPAVILQLVNVLIKLDRKKEAQELLEFSVTKIPNDILLRRALADFFVAKNQFDKAIEQYQKIDAMKPTDFEYLITWGELVMKTDKPDKHNEAVKIWSRLIELLPDDPMAAIRVAEIAARFDIVDAAEKYYKLAAELRPDDAAFREYLGVFYYRQSEIKKAIETILSIADNKQKNVDSLIHAGTLLQSIHAEKEALAVFENAVKLAPENAAIKWKYIEALMRNGEIDNAVAQLIETDKLIQSDDEFDVFLHNEIQFMMRSLQINNIAKKLSGKISDNSSNNIVTKIHWRRLYWRLAVYNQYAGKSETAIKMMDAAIEYQKNIGGNNTQDGESLSLRILHAAAELYDKCNAADKAIKILETLAGKNNIRQAAYIKQLAELQIKIGDKESAEKSIKRLLETGTANAAVIASCAGLLFELGRVRDAIELLRRGLRFKPNDLLIQKMLSEYLAKDGQLKSAIDIAQLLFDRTENIESKMQIAKTITEYYLVLDAADAKVAGKLSDDRLREFLYKIKNSADKLSAVLCVAVVFEVLSDFAAARSELEGFLIAAGEGRKADKLLLRKLVSVTEKMHDYNAAVKYQESICKDNSDSAELDKLFVLYDVNGNREKSCQLFMRLILNKTNINEQISMIDRMIGREEYGAVDHVLAFFEIHEESNWEIMYRQIVIAAYMRQKNLSELVRNFRGQKFVDAENKRNENLSADQFTKYLDDQFNNNAWKLPANLPTNDFTIWTNNSNAEKSTVKNSEMEDSDLLFIFRAQEVFLLTLFCEMLGRNQNYRTFNNVPPPKPFYRVNNFAEAKFLVLCWLLREESVEKIINDYNPTPKEIKRLKAIATSIKKYRNK